MGVYLFCNNTEKNRIKKRGAKFFAPLFSVPRAGIEPARMLLHWCLRPTRLPIPPPGQGGFHGANVEVFYYCAKFF